MPNSYGHLLKTQANDVLNVVSQSGLDPKVFAWDLEQGLTLRYTPSGDYYFTFDSAEYGGHQADYCPGGDTVHEYRDTGSWEQQLSRIDEWLTNLKREIEAPDLWSLLSEQTALVDAASTDSSNTAFSSAEIEKISNGLRELREYIESTQHLDEQKQAFLESRLRYLEVAAQRQGRQDWLQLAIGVLFTVVMGLAMAPEQAREVFRFISTVLQTILKSPPLLP